MNREARRKHRHWHEQGGLCIWCNNPARLIEWDTANGKPPDDMATLEHVVPRGDKKRGTFPDDGERRYAMACYACNHARGTKHMKDLRARIANSQQPRH